MSEWQCKMTLLVRALIDDLGEPPTYSDDKIAQIIVVAAQLIKKEVDFDAIYVTDIVGVDITPDPVDDDGFVNLVSLKTACLILSGEVKAAANSSVRVTDASATIDMSSKYGSTKDLYDQICKDYEKAKMAFVMGQTNTLKAILTPYTQNYGRTGFIFG